MNVVSGWDKQSIADSREISCVPTYQEDRAATRGASGHTSRSQPKVPSVVSGIFPRSPRFRISSWLCIPAFRAVPLAALLEEFQCIPLPTSTRRQISITIRPGWRLVRIREQSLCTYTSKGRTDFFAITA